MSKHVLDSLQSRGLLDAVAGEDLYEILAKPVKFYLGFDPTASSLHLGHLLGMVIMRHLQMHGHTPYVLLGGATAMVGDPSGKSLERPLLDRQEIEANACEIKKQFARVLDFENPLTRPVFVNNYDWTAAVSFLEMLRDIGKHFRVSTMLAKESVKLRLNSDEGISFTEFSYQLLQGYDFYHLREQQQVVLQIGGSDQWGNITAGIELIRKKGKKSAYGFTYPLLTRSDGKKIGKTEQGAAWLAAELFSPYQFYQYLFATPDADVIKMLKMLSFVPLEEIERLENSMQTADYKANTAQKLLAGELTLLLHGSEGLESALKATEAAAFQSNKSFDIEQLHQNKDNLPHKEFSKHEVLGTSLQELFVKAGLCTSKGEALRLVKNGGAYINNKKVEETSYVIQSDDLIGEQYLLLSMGKKNKMLLILH